MTGTELKTMTESILDDTVDGVLFYQLLNVAKNRIEDERPWMFLRALDSTQTAGTGDNTTTSHALPTLWRRTYKLMVGKYQQYEQVPFDEQHVWRYSSNRFCVDVANSVYYLLGNVGVADTIYHYYLKATADIDSASTWNAPTRFHPLLAYDVAGYVMLGIDADDVFARMSPENKAAAQSIKASMESWDTQLQIDAQGGRQQIEGGASVIDLGLM